MTLKEYLNKTKKFNPTPAGDKYLNVYQEQIDKNGIKNIIPNGKKNISELIQADLESTKIENILHQVAMGDLRALQQRDITYMDATTMPKSLMEMQNIGLKAKEEFESFPIEVRKMFNNSIDQYMAEMGTNEFFEKMGSYVTKVKDIKEAGNLKEYNKKVAEQAKFEKDVELAKGVKEE